MNNLTIEEAAAELYRVTECPKNRIEQINPILDNYLAISQGNPLKERYDPLVIWTLASWRMRAVK